MFKGLCTVLMHIPEQIDLQPLCAVKWESFTDGKTDTKHLA